ncbi:MAG: ribonuclease [Clostridiales bacterium]|nr:ribonuclease [Clostridiales bacterium]
MNRKILSLLLSAAVFLTGCSYAATYEEAERQSEDVIEISIDNNTEETVALETTVTSEAAEETTEALLDPDGTYTSKDDVALYLYTYGALPQNFITKNEARALGWEGGGLESYAPGMCIGGDYFGNYEGLLPDAPGREYRECDIDTLGASSRGAKRIIWSNDGLIYYTDDHYESFTLLYGEE